MKHLDAFPNIQDALNDELRRQREGLEMIPSENFVSPAVLEALGSIATNKYAEGVPGRRYYGGCEFIDKIERAAIDRAKELFGADHVNVQPLSGAPANMAAYAALLEPGDTVLGMKLSHGGHLTHGHPVTVMADMYNFKRYGTTKDGAIDYQEIERMAAEYKPKLILVGYSAYSRDIDYERIQAIADSVDAHTMADIAHIAGLIAGGQMNNPVEHFDIVTTTTHKTLRGPRGGMIMCKEKHAKRVDKAVFPGLQGGPHENVIAAKAVAFKEAQDVQFSEYAKQTIKNARVLAETLAEYEFDLVFGGTDNHLLLIDVTSKDVTGKQVEEALDKAGMTVNKNTIPDDPRSPMDPSGIRLGTPALTTRGMKEAEMKQIAEWINETVEHTDDEKHIKSIRAEVKKLTDRFPLYENLTY
jgi:glycine hydroxymethyltransferase